MNDQLIGDIGYNGKTFSQVLELECCEFLLDKFNLQNKIPTHVLSIVGLSFFSH